VAIEVAWKCRGCGCVFLALPLGTEGKDWEPTRILSDGQRSTFSQSPNPRNQNCPWCGCPKAKNRTDHSQGPWALWEPWCRVCVAARAEFAWECLADVCKGCYPLADEVKRAKVFAGRMRHG